MFPLRATRKLCADGMSRTADCSQRPLSCRNASWFELHGLRNVTFRVLLVCPGGGPGQLDARASFEGSRLPVEGEEIEVVRSDRTRARALVRLVETDDEPPITADLVE